MSANPERPAFDALGVGHADRADPEPLPDLRGADARSAEIDRPEGVSRSFQVIENKVEPSESVFARNLFAKDDFRMALADEMVPVRPKVPLVNKPIASACRGERLARATPGPDGAVIGPSSKSESERPSADPGEEMALGVTMQFIGSDVPYVAPIDHASRDLTLSDEFFQPVSRLVVDLVVEVHAFTFNVIL